MRFPTHTLILTATLAASLGAMQPVSALGLPTSDNPMTPEEKREQSRMFDAKRAALFRKKAEVMRTYADSCEAALAAGEPMPEPDIRITEEIVTDEDLLGMTVEEISEQFDIALDATQKARRAMKACIRMYAKKRNEGS